MTDGLRIAIRALEAGGARCRRVAYPLLGSAGEADGAVQEAYLR